MVDMRNGGGGGEALEAVKESDADQTRADDSAQPSASTSTIVHEEMAPSNAPSKASSTRTSTPAVASAELHDSAHTANGTSAPLEQTLEAQSTTHGALTTSAKGLQDTPAAPYGTRSRNRPGTSRINYAEDVEMEFEMAPASTNGNASDPSSHGLATTEGKQSIGVGGKKGSHAAGSSHAPWGTSAPHSKDHPPKTEIESAPTSVPSPAPAPAPPAKRRKNAAAHATNGTHANTAAPSQTATRRANNAAVAPNSTRETNMLTFENTGARLKNHRLQADDGQTVSINGMLQIRAFFNGLRCNYRLLIVYLAN
jgi:hypothetical protein